MSIALPSLLENKGLHYSRGSYLTFVLFSLDEQNCMRYIAYMSVMKSIIKSIMQAEYGKYSVISSIVIHSIVLQLVCTKIYLSSTFVVTWVVQHIMVIKCLFVLLFAYWMLSLNKWKEKEMFFVTLDLLFFEWHGYIYLNTMALYFVCI